MLCPDGKLVLAVRGMKNVYDIDPGQAKEAVTCMHTFNANGDAVPPMLIYPYQRIPTEIAEKVAKDCGTGRSESGWMTAEVFYEYIGNVFNTHIEKLQIERPLILFVDGHKSHLTIHTSRLCKELRIGDCARGSVSKCNSNPAASRRRSISSYQDGVDRCCP